MSEWKRIKIKGKQCCLYLYPERQEEEERIQNPVGGTEKRGEHWSGNLCVESEWQEVRSEFKIYYVAEKEVLIPSDSKGGKA